MASTPLTGTKRKDTYTWLLHVGTATLNGLKRVFTGAGTETALSLGPSSAKVDGDLTVTGTVTAASLEGAASDVGNLTADGMTPGKALLVGPDNNVVEGDAAADHNTLENLQGGTTGEHYHLTAAEAGKVASFGSTMASEIDAASEHANPEDTQQFAATDAAGTLLKTSWGNIVAKMDGKYADLAHASTHAGANVYTFSRTITGAVGTGAFSITDMLLPPGTGGDAGVVVYEIQFSYTPPGAAISFTKIDITGPVPGVLGTPYDITGFAAPTAITNGYRLTIDSSPASLRVGYVYAGAGKIIVSGETATPGESATFDITATVAAGTDPVLIRSSQILDAGYAGCVPLLDSNGTLPAANLPVGSAAGTVAAGDHNHTGTYAAASHSHPSTIAAEIAAAPSHANPADADAVALRVDESGTLGKITWGNVASKFAAASHAAAHAGASSTVLAPMAVTGGSGGTITNVARSVPAGNYSVRFGYNTMDLSNGGTVALVLSGTAGFTWSGASSPWGSAGVVEGHPEQLAFGSPSSAPDYGSATLSVATAGTLTISGSLGAAGNTATIGVTLTTAAGTDPITIRSDQIVDSNMPGNVPLLDSNGTLPLANGGTGAATAGAALTNLGAGSAALKNVPVTGQNASTAQVVMGDDTRLTNARTPTAHAATHAGQIVHSATVELTGGSGGDFTTASLGTPPPGKYNLVVLCASHVSSSPTANELWIGTGEGPTLSYPYDIVCDDGLSAQMMASELVLTLPDPATEAFPKACVARFFSAQVEMFLRGRLNAEGDTASLTLIWIKGGSDALAVDAARQVFGKLPVANLPVGSAAGTVAAGDHNHTGTYAAASHAAAHAGASSTTLSSSVTAGSGGTFSSGTIATIPAGTYTVTLSCTAYSQGGAESGYVFADISAGAWSDLYVDNGGLQYAEIPESGSGLRVQFKIGRKDAYALPQTLTVTLTTTGCTLSLSGTLVAEADTATFEAVLATAAGSDPITIRSDQIVDAGLPGNVPLLGSNATLPVANGGTGAATAAAALTNLGATAVGSSLVTAATAGAAVNALGTLKTTSPCDTVNSLGLAIDQSAGSANVSLNLQAKGAGAFYLGPPADGTATGGNVRGDYAVDLQISRNLAANIASGEGSFTFPGVGCKASGKRSVAGGLYTIASSQYSFCYAQTGTASADSSVALGGYGPVASASGSIALGTYALADSKSKLAIGGDGTPASGTGQYGISSQYVQTTDGTAATMLYLARNYCAFAISGTVVATVKGTTTQGDTCAWTFSGVLKRGKGAGTTALLAAITPAVLAADAGAAAWTVAVAADATEGGLLVTVRDGSETPQTIRWVCTVKTTEVTF